MLVQFMGFTGAITSAVPRYSSPIKSLPAIRRLPVELTLLPSLITAVRIEVLLLAERLTRRFLVLLAPWCCFVFPVLTIARTSHVKQKASSLFICTIAAATAPSPVEVRTETGRGHRQRPRLVRVEARDETVIAVAMVLLVVVPLFIGVALRFALAPATTEPGFYDALGFIVGAVSCVTCPVVNWAPRRQP